MVFFIFVVKLIFHHGKKLIVGWNISLVSDRDVHRQYKERIKSRKVGKKKMTEDGSSTIL